VSTRGGGEQQAGLVAGRQAVAVLPLLVGGQRYDADGGEGQDSAGASGFGRAVDDTLATYPLQGPTDAELFGGQVDVGPAQAEEFAATLSEAECEDEQCVESMLGGDGQKAAGFDVRPGPDLIPVGDRAVGLAGPRCGTMSDRRRFRDRITSIDVVPEACLRSK
jgi:hypothetical protein